MGARLEAVVEGLLEPVPEDRLPAEDALAILQGRPRPARWVAAGRSGRGVLASPEHCCMLLGVHWPARGGQAPTLLRPPCPVSAGARCSRRPATAPTRLQTPPGTGAAPPAARSLSRSGARASKSTSRPAASGAALTWLLLPQLPSSAGPPQRPATDPIAAVPTPPHPLPPWLACSSDSLATGAFAIAWNSFVAFWTISALAGGGLLFGLFSLPFWAAGWTLAKQAFGRQFIRWVGVGGGRQRWGAWGWAGVLRRSAHRLSIRPAITCFLPGCLQGAPGHQPHQLESGAAAGVCAAGRRRVERGGRAVQGGVRWVEQLAGWSWLPCAGSLRTGQHATASTAAGAGAAPLSFLLCAAPFACPPTPCRPHRRPVQRQHRGGGGGQRRAAVPAGPAGGRCRAGPGAGCWLGEAASALALPWPCWAATRFGPPAAAACRCHKPASAAMPRQNRRRV